MDKVFYDQLQGMAKVILNHPLCSQPLTNINSICSERLALQVEDELIEDIANLIQDVYLTEYYVLRDKHIITDSTRTLRLNHYGKLTMSIEYIEKLFLKYTLLKDSIVRCVTNRTELVRDVLRQYAEDKTQLVDKFEMDFGEVNAINWGKGDEHDGKSVCKVSFEFGTLYYKPRSGMTQDLFNSLIRIIDNKANDYLYDLFFSKGDHSWYMPIEHREAESLDEVKEYYERAGVLLSAMYLCSSTDMHSENIICCGDKPYIIDFETIVSPRVCSLMNAQLGKTLDSSVLQSRMLPLNVENDIFDYDVSGLFAEKVKSKLIRVQSIEEDEKYDVAYRYRYVEGMLLVSALHYKNGCANIVDVLPFLLRGFEIGCKSIQRNKDQIIDLICAQTFSAMRVRQLLRPTYTYAKFISESQKASCVRSKENRETLFDILRDKFHPSKKYGYTRLEYEIAEMRNGNIPLFYSLFGGHDLFANGEIICTSYFEQSAKESILAKLHSFSDEMIDYQKRMISMSLFAHTAESNLQHDFSNDFIIDDKQNKREVEEYLCTARKWCDQFSDYLLSCECPIDASHSTILLPIINQLEPHFENKAIISMAQPDFYFSGGLIFYLFAYAKVSSNYSYKQYGDRLLRNVHDALINPDAITSMNCFTLYGYWGSSLYIKYNEYLMFGEQEDYESTINIIQIVLSALLKYEYHRPDSDFDFMHGNTGILCLVGKILLNDKGLYKMYIDDFKTITSIYLHFLRFNAVNINPGFAHGGSGIIAALSVMSNIVDVNVEEFAKYILYDDEIFWKDNASLVGWCNGAAGQVLARGIALMYAKDSLLHDIIITSLQRYLAKTLKSYVTNCKELCLCHGAFGVSSILNYVLPMVENGESCHRQVLLKKNPMDINWISNIHYPYESFMTGISGVLYEHLRLLDNNLPCTLAIDLYQNHI